MYYITSFEGNALRLTAASTSLKSARARAKAYSLELKGLEVLIELEDKPEHYIPVGLYKDGVKVQ